MESPEHQRREIVRYFEMEHGDATVEHAEKVASERIYGKAHDVWDVHSTDGKWWVITNLTNLYSQTEYPRMDYLLSFHIGLMARIHANQALKADVPDEQQDRSAAAWRQFEQAAATLNSADEAEDFQSVGNKCRQALVTFARNAADEAMVPSGDPPPKASDFIHWTELIANAVAPGESASKTRAYLKQTAKSTWALASWLVHAENATRFDGWTVLDATSNVMSTLGNALLRFEEGIPDRCPTCSSYRLYSDFRTETDSWEYVTLCEACGWESPPRPAGGAASD